MCVQFDNCLFTRILNCGNRDGSEIEHGDEEKGKRGVLRVKMCRKGMALAK